MTDIYLSDRYMTCARKVVSNGLRQLSGMRAGLRFIGTKGIKKVIHAGFAITMIGDAQVMAHDIEFYPDFVGGGLSFARDFLDEHGIGLLIKKLDGPFRRGQILGQIPPDGSDTPLGPTAEMYFVVSDGLVVPDVTGLRDHDAKSKLERMGFWVHINEMNIEKDPYNKNSYFKYRKEVYLENSDSIKPGTTAYTIPRAGTRIDPIYTIVTINALSKVRIPTNVLDYRIQDLIKDPNITYILYVIKDTCYQQMWFCGSCIQNIISSDPAPGKIINIGAKVKLHVEQYMKQGNCSGLDRYRKIPY